MSDSDERTEDLKADALDFTTRVENGALAQCLVSRAQRELVVLTPDLEAAVYDTAAFLDAVVRLSTRSRHSNIRVLVADPTRALKYGHRLIELARRFTSSIQVRKPPPEHRDFCHAYLIVDRLAVLHKNDSNRYAGHADTHNPLLARQLLKEFDPIWDLSQVDVELRRLYI